MVYRIFEAQGQTQICTWEKPADLDVAFGLVDRDQKLGPAILGPIGRLNQPGGPPGLQRLMAFVKARDKNALAPRQAQLVQTTPHEQPLDQVRQTVRRLDGGLGGAGEQPFLGGLIYGLAR